MAYQTYITEALVCGVRASNTSDLVYILFTREAGMVFAHAKSVREEKSKHRYALQPFSCIRVTLVRGKASWKITGSEPIKNFYSEAQSREERSMLRNTVLLLRRVMQGETAHASIFDDVVSACHNTHVCNIRNLEHVLFLRVLHALGYVAPKEEYQSLLHSEFSVEKINTLDSNTAGTCQEVVAYALTQSQL